MSRHWYSLAPQSDIIGRHEKEAVKNLLPMAGEFQRYSFSVIRPRLVLQWAGDAKALAAALAPVGWAQVPELSLSTLNRYLTSRTSPGDLPALPKLNDGRSPESTLIHLVSNSQREVMRIWRSRAALSDGSTVQPIRLASVTRERIEHPFGILTLSRKREDHSVDIAALESALPNAIVVTRRPAVEADSN